MGAVILLVQYFVLLAPFSLLAKRAARRERLGWATGAGSTRSLTSQY